MTPAERRIAADPLTVMEEETVCPACHHRDHDPGSCPSCPRCELHTDEAFAFVLRIEPELLAEHGYFKPRPGFLSRLWRWLRRGR